MLGRRDHWSKAGAATVALALLVAGAVAAQDPAAPPKGVAPAKGANPDPKDKGKAAKKGRLLKAPGRAPAKGVARAGDPLAKAAANAEGVVGPGQAMPAPGTFHYRFKFAVADIDPLSAAYYPSKAVANTNTTPVVLLIHERERSGKDFEEPIAELKKATLAEELQKQGYAVLALDYRGHGASTPRRTLAKAEWRNVATDLQAAYFCLVDRHNWGELNLAKLGVVALGEGANVAAAWAALGGGVSSEGRASDLGALVLVSPMVDAQSQGSPPGRPSAPWPPGSRSTCWSASATPPPPRWSTTGRPRSRRSSGGIGSTRSRPSPRPSTATSSSSSSPILTGSIFTFLDGTIKAKADEWEGRYLTTPVTYSNIQVIKNPVRVDPAAAEEGRELIPSPICSGCPSPDLPGI